MVEVNCIVKSITGTAFKTTATGDDKVTDLIRRIDKTNASGDVVNLFDSEKSYSVFVSGDDGAIDTKTSSFVLMDCGEALIELNYKDTLGNQIGDRMAEAAQNGETLTFLTSTSMVVG